MSEFFRLGTQFVGYRDLSNSLKGIILLFFLDCSFYIMCANTTIVSVDLLAADLAKANKRANALALKLEQSEKAREKAESAAAVVEDLRKRLHSAETSLSDHLTQQTAREKEIITRLSSQCRRFVSKYFNLSLFDGCHVFYLVTVHIFFP
jgi:Flp pilus assembly protein TadB